MRFLAGIFVWVVLSAAHSQAQDTDTLRLGLSIGGPEAKRNTLFRIRNLRSESASRAAIPALSDKDAVVRATAAAAVIFLPMQEAASLLIPLLNDKSPFVRTEAAYALGDVRHPSAVAPLITTLRNDAAPETRSAAAVALGKIGDISAVAPLMTILKRKPADDDEYFRRSAARAIGKIADNTGLSATSTRPELLAAARVLITVLESKSEADDTRREAAAALGSIKDPVAVGSLRKNINSNDPYLVEICLAALAKIAAAE